MTHNLEDTQPRRPADFPVYSTHHDDAIPAPPPLLLWAVIGIFLLAIIGSITGVVVFRSVLLPAQQERIMGVLPFMEAFLPPRPAADDTLPTPEGAVVEDLSPEDLLSGLFSDNDAPDNQPPAAIPPAGAGSDETEIEALATATPTSEPTIAPTATVQPTATVEPTAETQSQEAETEQVAVNPPDEQPVSTELPQTAVVSQNNPPAPVQAAVNLPATARMTGFIHEQQTWNNCGPANVTMALTYYGWRRNQEFAASFLKPGGREDKNVSPSEMVSFVNENTSVKALWRVGGSVNMLREFIANDIPVIIETGYMPEGYAWMGHYQTVVGYDNNQGIFWLYDSFLGSGENGEGIAETYNYLDRHWQHFNRIFIVVYEPQREELVRRILGDLADPQVAAQRALEVATDEATANSTNGHAWFNMGSSLVALGDYDRAARAYDRALREGVPWRMLWYQHGPYEAYYNAGRYDDVLSLVSANLPNGADFVEETYYWQGRALAALGRTNEAATAFRTAIRRNPRYVAAQDALRELGV
jgi:hypothetical protein